MRIKLVLISVLLLGIYVLFGSGNDDEQKTPSSIKEKYQSNKIMKDVVEWSKQWQK